MRAVAVLALLVIAASACSGVDGNRREAAGVRLVLPEPEHLEGRDLAEIILGRVSQREYAETPLTMDQVGLILSSAAGYAGDGITGATRAAPSAGATHPLSVYLVAGNVDGLEPGVFRYDPSDHSLTRVVGRDVRADLARACLGQEPVSRAPAAVVVSADFARTTDWYGDRGTRYVHMESGAVMQNVGLMAEALGLGAVAVGAFDDGKVAEILRLDTDPLLVIPLGYLP